MRSRPGSGRHARRHPEQCSAVQCSAAKCSAVHCSAVVCASHVTTLASPPWTAWRRPSCRGWLACPRGRRPASRRRRRGGTCGGAGGPPQGPPPPPGGPRAGLGEGEGVVGQSVFEEPWPQDARHRHAHLAVALHCTPGRGTGRRQADGALGVQQDREHGVQEPDGGVGEEGGGRGAEPGSAGP